MPFLGLADASGIQRFLLHSPELRKIAAASRQIEHMCLPGGLYFNTPAECLVAAGGNAILRADTQETLFFAFQQISRTLLESGDDLQVVGCIEEYTDGKLPQAYRSALRRLDQRKLSQPRGTEFVFSGLTAPQHDTPFQQSDSPQRGLIRFNGKEYRQPQQLEDMICLSAEAADLMAVVSVDGIGMGKKLNEWLAQWLAGCETGQRDSSDHLDTKFIEEFRAWSGSLKERWRCAWEEAVSTVMNAFTAEHSYTHPYFEGRRLELRRDPQSIPFVPCRHVYQGGDDLSFICDARLALSLTTRLMELLRDLPAEAGIPALFESIPTSAGVVFVDSHFPFSRAISLSEQVRQAAKVKAQETDPEHPPCALNWWVNRSGATVYPKPLFEGATRKPYLLSGEDNQTGWHELDTQVLPGLWQTFGTARNKLKDVLAAAEANDRGATVRRLLQQRPLRDTAGGIISRPFPWERSEVSAQSGFNGSGQTMLLDTGELYDIYFPCISPAGFLST